MLDFHVDTLVPELEDTCRKESQGGIFDVIVRYCYDGARAHTEDNYMKVLRQMFEERGWLFVLQPSQSPLTNVLDAAVFPSISKTVSKNQTMLFGPTVLHSDQLWETVKQSWNEMPLSVIARAFASHHQIASAIYKYGGNNDYLYEKKASMLVTEEFIIWMKMD